MSAPELSREQLATLIPLCPLLMDWLRNVTTETADLLMQSKAEDYSKVAFGLDSLIKCLEDNSSSNSSSGLNIPYTTYAPLFSQYPPSVWANALRLILTQASPRLMSPEIGSDLVGTIPRLNGASTVTEICHILGPYLDKLPRSHFETLGEFCALIRDTATNITLLACLVGPQILMPNLSLNAEISQGPGALAASAVMELLIIESESLFGRCASSRVYYPFGAYNQRDDSELVTGAIDFIGAVNDPKNTVLKQTLRAFYDWRDPIRAYHVDSLFKVYPAHQIAGALQSRYGVLPPGWGYILQALVNKEATAKQIEDGKYKGGIVADRRKRLESSAGANGAPAAPGSDIKRVPTPPPDSMNRPLATNVTEELMSKLKERDVGTDAGKVFKENDNLINEICSHEKAYFDVINVFLEAYVTQLTDILEGRSGGEEGRTALGLGPEEVESLCGDRFRKVRDVSNQLLAKMDVITMFQGQPAGSRGRVGLLVDAFQAVLGDMACLSPYICNYEKNIKMLTQKSNELDGMLPNGKKKKRNKKKDSKGQNFLEIWELERAKHDALKLSRMDNILIKPVQRLPMYKIQFGSLVKTTDKDHPAYEDLLKVQQGIEDLARRIDKEMKSKKKAEKLLGIE